MSIVDRIKLLATAQNTSIKRIERDCEIGNATIRRWDVNSPSLENVKKVANHLHSSIDYLAFGTNQTTAVSGQEPTNFETLRAEQGLSCDGHPLNEMEADLVAMYRLLGESGMKEAFDYVYFKYKRHVEEKKESIYSTYTESDPEDGSKTTHGIA